jgi:hypothetical protein
MEDYSTTPRPTVSSTPPRRPMDDFTPHPTRPTVLPVRESSSDDTNRSRPESIKVVEDSEDVKTLEQASKIEVKPAPLESQETSEFQAPTPIIEPKVEVEPEKKAIVPGLDPKPSEKDDTVSQENEEVPVSSPPEEVDEKFEVKPGASFNSDGVVTVSPSVKPNKKGKSAVIMVAILIALSLIGGAGYAYLQNQKTTPDASPAVTKPAVTETKKDPASAADVDKTSQEIDASLKKVDDTKDFQESDLTDTTLGL